MASIADIRKKLKELEEKSSGSSSNSDNTLYPHWNIPDDGSSTLRFLPDGDPDNTFFWQEKQMINLPFPGVKGGDERKEVVVKVPCIEMWGDTCPVHQEIRPWFKDPSLEDTARKYWKKRSYLFQGFVQKDGIPEDSPPESLIRRFVLSPQIFNLVKAALLDEDLIESPVDYENGLDFVVNKTKNGQWASYVTSRWARRETPLTVEQLEAIESEGLRNLASFLPERPDDEHLEAIVQMFEASVDGELYDPVRWANFYKPYGLNYGGNTSSVTVTAGSSAAFTDDNDDDESPDADNTSSETTSDAGSSVAAILAKLKQGRQSA